MGFRINRVKRDASRWWNDDVRRFRMNLNNIFNKDRSDYRQWAREDLSHSYVNIFVELLRWLAYPLGHVFALLPLIAVVGLILTGIGRYVLPALGGLL